ncbi:M18 family aminopeptidase [Aurantivibrio plasticivorans]
MNNQETAVVSFNQQLLKFLQQSPTPFHATQAMVDRFRSSGFKVLDEAESWALTPGEKYLFVRNDSSVIAFIYGKQPLLQSGVRMVGAHTDSPCLRVKPNPQYTRQGLMQLGIEVYGGALLNPWFDRDLSLAGRVTFVDESGVIGSCLIDFKRPIAIIPSLAIHLDREANNSRSINAQKDIPPVLAIVNDDNEVQFSDLLIEQIRHQQPESKVSKILSHELSFYDFQPPQLVGLRQDFIASARLDNLLSCFVGMEAMLEADGEQSCLLVCNDHEEVGSQSTSGAAGPMLADFIARLVSNESERQQIIAKSLLVSADNAHAIHPNFADKHDQHHGPLLNKGPVVKVNANQRYATNSNTHGQFNYLAEQVDVPVQTFVTRTDMACGSTIGPITATAIGVPTLDVGIPTFGMHSIRELAGTLDAFYLFKVLKQFHASPIVKN